MRSVNVRLRDEELRRLVDLALKERRCPSDQAAVLIAEALKNTTSGGDSSHIERRLVPA